MGKWCSVCLPWFGLEEESNKDDEEASSPHLAGLGWVAEYSAEWGKRERREREVITVVKLTGNVASPWRLVMIAAAGNNKTPTLRNYWPPSLTLDKSNNAHYPHIPLYSRTSEGAEAANEICCAGSWVGWRLWLTGGRLPAVLCDVTTLALSLSLSCYEFIRFSAPSFYFSWFDFVPLGQRGKIRKLKRHQETVDSSLDSWQAETTNIRHWQWVNKIWVRERGRQKGRECSHITITFNYQTVTFSVMICFSFI